jgi:hypothetical protein
MQANKQLTQFLKDNPNSSKAAISEATGLNGLLLFNLLKKLRKEGIIISEGEGPNITISLVEANDEEKSEEHIEPSIEEPVEETDIEEPIIKPFVRDNSKFKFNNEMYGKGPLVRAVIAQYAIEHPSITYKQLKEIFPDTLLKRFGIFQDELKAREISDKYDRYFFKPEQIIKLKDRKIVVCNQFTFTNIQPFLKVVKSLGYKIK